MKQMFFVLLVLATQAFGFERGRVAWVYDTGYLVQDALSGGWIETCNSVECFYFKEQERNNDYVQLFDSTRNMSMRLYRDAMYLKGPGDTQYRSFKRGQWDDRRMWYYTDASGEVGYFQLIGGSMYRYFVRNGTQTSSTYLRILSRDGVGVRLHDPRNNVNYTLNDTEMYKGANGGGVLYLDKRGSWR